MVGNTYVTGLPIVKDPITLQIAVEHHGNDEYVDDFSKKTFVSIAEEATGITIEWLTPSAEQMAAILAGGDMPDAIIGKVGDNTIVENPSLFRPLGDMLEKFAPNVLMLYEEHIPGWREFLTFPDGQIYGLMGGYYQSYLHLTDCVVWINKTWLDNVGKDMPTTTEEFKDVLKVFKEQDADGDGDPDNEIPMDFCNAQWAGGIQYMAGSWGIQGNFNLIDSQIIPAVNTDNYRAYLEYYHELVGEGLVNAEGFSQTTQQYYANISTLKDGVFLGWAPPTFMSEADSILQYEPMPVLAVPGLEDIRTTYSGSKQKSQQTRNGFVIPATCAEPEAALRWWDYLSSSQDMAMLVAWGEEGVGYVKGDDGKYYIKDIPADLLRELNLTSPTAYKASIGIINHHPLVLSNLSVDVEANPTLSDACRQRGIDAVYAFLPEQTMPRYIIPADKQEELTLLSTDLNALYSTFRADSILNGVTDASWEAYKQQLESYGYEQVLQWNQDYFDGKFK